MIKDGKYYLGIVKPKKNTHLFKKNQKCWIISVQGDNSIRVRAKHRGRNRYLVAWLHERDYDSSSIQSIEVTKGFYERTMGNYN